MLIGLSMDHRQFSVQEREPFMLAESERQRLARLVRRSCAGQVVFLQTCNRIELYAWVDSSPAGSARARLWRTAARIDPGRAGRFFAAATFRADEGAARHLLRVAAGLESQIDGDVQVLGQVRSAYALATRSGSAGPELHRLFQTALRAGKRVHAETDLGRRQASVGAQAARCLRGLEGQPVVLLGAGKTAEYAARALLRQRMTVTIVNRTEARSTSLAEGLGVASGHFDDRYDLIAAARAVIVVTAASGPTVTRAELEVARSRDGLRCSPLTIIDLSMPRNVQPAVTDLAGVQLLGLEAVDSGNEGGTRLYRVAAEAIVEEELAGFLDWCSRRHDRRSVA